MTTTTLPRAVELLEQRATAAGWRVEIRTFAYGAAVYLRRSGEAINAIWVQGKFDSAWQRVDIDPEQGGVSPRRIGARELTAIVTGAQT